jgi:predicted metal-dependent peptidase
LFLTFFFFSTSFGAIIALFPAHVKRHSNEAKFHLFFYRHRFQNVSNRQSSSIDLSICILRYIPIITANTSLEGQQNLLKKEATHSIGCYFHQRNKSYRSTSNTSDDQAKNQ